MPSIRALALSLAALCSAPAIAQVPDPVDFFGHEVGADYKLVNYSDMMAYFRKVEATWCPESQPTRFGRESVA